MAASRVSLPLWLAATFPLYGGLSSVVPLLARPVCRCRLPYTAGPCVSLPLWLARWFTINLPCIAACCGVRPWVHAAACPTLPLVACRCPCGLPAAAPYIAACCASRPHSQYQLLKNGEHRSHKTGEPWVCICRTQTPPLRYRGSAPRAASSSALFLIRTALIALPCVSASSLSLRAFIRSP